MSERPILFSGPMVRAILAGTKTQTRRIPGPMNSFFGSASKLFWEHADFERAFADGVGTGDEYLHVPTHVAPDCETCAHYGWQGTVHRLWCRYAPAGATPFVGEAPASRLWVRETHLLDPPIDGTWPNVGDTYASLEDIPERYRSPKHVIYHASDGWTEEQKARWRWRPSIFMPRWASRITLEVTEVRVQRLQEISEEDAVAEGVFAADLILPHSMRARTAFAEVWDSINGKRAPWSSNPWVWAVSFKRVA